MQNWREYLEIVFREIAFPADPLPISVSIFDDIASEKRDNVKVYADTKTLTTFTFDTNTNYLKQWFFY